MKDKEKEQERAILRGKVSEDQFFRALSARSEDAPSWFVSIRRATEEEDQRGFDAFILTTDVGEIPIQIKSSRQGVRNFRQKRPGNPAIPVVITVSRRWKPIRKQIFDLVGMRRVRILKRK